jgi:hypothetical protein
MAESAHVRGKKKGEFCACAVSGGKCECGHNFRAQGKPAPWFFPYQAHHLLPVTCVNSVLVSKTEINGILRATKWCINAKANMYGMPVWGDTVRWYCKITAVLRLLRTAQVAPVWKNIPQHLNDHNLYNEEVASHLMSVSEGWRVTEHEITTGDIAGDLETISEMMLTDLKTRGLRTGGTHTAWTSAIQESEAGREFPGWYKPFSMAEEPCERAFPVRGASSSESGWIDRISEALRK